LVTAFPRFQILPLFAAAATLAGCAQEASPAPTPHAAAPQAFTLREQTESHTLQLGSDGKASALERDRLDAFIANLAIKRPDALHVSVGGTSNDVQLQGAVRMLAEDGIDPTKIVLAPTRQAAAATGQVIVEIDLYRADAPACAPWSTIVSATDDGNTGRPDLGCSDLANLDAMVADPRDLIKSSTTPYANGVTSATAVQRYNEDDVKPLPEASGFGAIPKNNASGASSSTGTSGTSGGM
jgi:pilus biogenesis lipoprotein CpaD